MEPRWPAADPEPLGEVYAEDAVFRSHPFREADEGREGVLAYARWVFADQEGFRGCSFGEPVVARDRGRWSTGPSSSSGAGR